VDLLSFNPIYFQNMASFSLNEEHSICPDIYHPAVARDGLLTRLRIPGGVLNGSQCVAIAELLETIGIEYIQVTNRANLQLRALSQDLDEGLLVKLADCGLAASNIAIDGIRNIMLSPTAGIDESELIDVYPLAAAWHQYLTEHPELGVLSNKFSVGFDGGGTVSIVDRPNDITLLARFSKGEATPTTDEFSLHLAIGDRGDAPVDVGVRLSLAECLPMLAAIAHSYLQGIELLGGDSRRKPRLRDIIRHWGLMEFGEIVQREFKGSSRFIFKNLGLESELKTDICSHLGVYRQRQVDRYYLGVVLPLGRWTRSQIRGLGSVADRYGSGTIRLTPWQNIIIPDVAESNLAQVQELIADLGLIQTANHPSSLLRACAGTSGCQFASTDTQSDALALIEYLDSKLKLDRSINIHFSGCEKSCAQHDRADIALWGYPEGDRDSSSYRLCVSGGTDKFGRVIRDNLKAADVPMAIEHLITIYHHHRTSPTESFRAFTDRFQGDALLAIALPLALRSRSVRGQG
jgi:ferredoxin-nitrite reductase